MYVNAHPENGHTNTSAHHNASVTHSDIFCPAAVSTAKSCLMRHQGLSSCHTKMGEGYTHTLTHTTQSPYWPVSVIHALTLSVSICCSFPLCHYSSSQLYCHIHSLCPYLSFSQCLSVQISLPFSPFSHNHLTPLRASAETGFTPQPSL